MKLRCAFLFLAAIILLAADPPYPPSSLTLAWAPYDQRVVIGSDTERTGDNWPITWGEDDVLYTSYGDGSGFSNRQLKLTIGFSKIHGDPPSLRAEDVPSDADTPMGGGRNGIKSSGMLMVDRVLYMFVRNYKVDGDYCHARLAWSKNYMKNWTWADWYLKDTFGCPEFVQFGKNYQGARDEYVYVVSQANNDAYEFSLDIVLARVPEDRITERKSYEFFAGMTNGRPQWSADISQRKPIFTDAAGTQRVAITYNVGLRRYILTTSHKTQEGAHNASLGVFDAPDPWGPWSTLYYDDHWSGNDRTYHHKFPTKWMSKDGKSMWLLYSGLDGGNYAFCLRRVVLK